jgi:hypothetical protein
MKSSKQLFDESLIRADAILNYSPKQQRGDDGKWSKGGGSVSSYTKSADGYSEVIKEAKKYKNAKDFVKSYGLSKAKFYSKYYQHIDLRGRQSGNAVKNIENINKKGFERLSASFGNTFPVGRGGFEGTMADRYLAKKNDVVYLVPKVNIDKNANIKNGWKPKPYEIIIAKEDAPNMYTHYQDRLTEIFEMAK